MLSVIIPSLNETATLPRTIPHLIDNAGGREVEILVSDCRSIDGTADLARKLGATVIEGALGRAEALNRGADAACGDVLLFLHADSLTPQDYPRLIERALRRPQFVGGAFDFKFGSHPLHHGFNRLKLRIVRFSNRLRFRYTRNFYGDQGIFVRREIFDRIGGFPLVPLMEDIRFAQKMNRLGQTAILNPPVRTSPRRFVERGVLTQFAHDLVLIWCEALCIEPASLWRRYNGWNHNGDHTTFVKPVLKSAP